RNCREGTRAVGFLVFFCNEPYAGGVLIDHSVGTFKVQEDCPRSRMAPRSELDGYIPLSQNVIRPHDVVDTFYLVIDMLHTRIGRGKQGDLVMNFINAQ